MDHLARIRGTVLQSRLIETSDEASHRNVSRGLQPFQEIITPQKEKSIQPKRKIYDNNKDENVQNVKEKENDKNITTEPGALAGYYMSHSIRQSLNEFSDNLDLEKHDEIINHLIDEYGPPVLVREFTYEDLHLMPSNLQEYQDAQDARLEAIRKAEYLYSFDDNDDSKILQSSPWIIDRNTIAERTIKKYLFAIYDKVELRIYEKRDKMERIRNYREMKQKEKAKVIRQISAKMKRYVPMIAKKNTEMKKWEIVCQEQSKEVKAYCEFIPNFEGIRLEELIQSVLEDIPFRRERAYHPLLRDSMINPASPKIKEEDNKLMKAKRATLREIARVFKRDQDREGVVRQMECQAVQFIENMLGKDADQPTRFQKIMDPLQHEKHDLEHAFYSLLDLKKVLEETVDGEEMEYEDEAKHKHMRIENKRLRSIEKSLLALSELESKLRDFFRSQIWSIDDYMLLKKIHIDQREYYGDYYMDFNESEFTSSESGESEEIRSPEEDTKEEKLATIAKKKEDFEEEMKRKKHFVDKYYRLVPKQYRERMTFGTVKGDYKEIMASKDFSLHEKERAATVRREQEERIVRLKNFSKKYRKIWEVRERRLQTMKIKLTNLRIESDLRQAVMSGEYHTLHKLPLRELVRLKVNKPSELPRKDCRQTGPLCEYIEKRHKVEYALKQCRVDWPDWSETDSDVEMPQPIPILKEDESIVLRAVKLKQRGIFVDESLRKKWQEEHAQPKPTYLEQALKISDNTDWGYEFKNVQTDLHPVYPSDGKKLGKGIHSRDYELFSLNWFGPGKKFDMEREQLEEKIRKEAEEQEKRDEEQRKRDLAGKWHDVQQKRLEAWKRKYRRMMESIDRKVKAFDRLLARRQYYEEIKIYGESTIPRPDTEFVWRMKERRDTAPERMKDKLDENVRKKALQLMIAEITDQKKVRWDLHSG